MSDPFQELLDALADRTISDEQFAELEQLVNDDSELRQRFLDYQNLCGSLEAKALRYGESRQALNLQAAIESNGINEYSPRDTPRSDSHQGDLQLRPKRRGVLHTAGILVAGLLVGLPLGWILNQRTSDAVPPGLVANADVVARLISVSDDTVWSDAHGSARLPGESLGKGWMRLDAGDIELEFASGATVSVTGPAAFGVDTPLRGFLDYGTVSIHAPEEARDFVVGTAAMDVVDLGTRFNMTIDEDSGEAEVEVIEGLVDLHLEGEGTSNRIQSLLAGQSARVNAEGGVIQIDGQALDARHAETSGLLGHWTLDDVGADGRIADHSGNELHGTLNQEARDRFIEGKVGRALNLGKVGYVDLSEHIPTLTGTPAYSLTAWVRNSHDMVFSFSNGTSLDRVQFELHRNQLYYGWQKGDRFDRIQTRGAEWDTGRWYHVAVSVSGGNVTIYRDGQAQIEPTSYGKVLGTRARAPIDIEQPTHACLGFLIANHAQRKQFLGGQLDDVQFYGRALDERAIRFLYEHPGETYSQAQSAVGLQEGVHQ